MRSVWLYYKAMHTTFEHLSLFLYQLVFNFPYHSALHSLFLLSVVVVVLLLVLLTYNSEGTITEKAFGFQDLLIIVKSLGGLKLTLRDQMFNLKGYWMKEQHPNPLFRRCGFTSVRVWVFHKIKNITLNCLKLMQWRIEIARNLAAIFRTIKLPTLNLKTPPQTRMRSHWKVVLVMKISANWFLCI